ncbi:inositol-3-phosphate synthase [Candidatus Woesearchaeota archaeon]|nr:inositol-3-phosphate synthase [Candidatus Woesearchaeota archaeon]
MSEKKIKIAIAGVGNCASSLVQGFSYYKDVKENDELIPGLMHNVMGGYGLGDIEPVAAFDIDERKVNKPLEEAIFAKPNCTLEFQREIYNGLGKDLPVLRGPTFDGLVEKMKDFGEKFFIESSEKPVDVTQELKNSGAEILINYLPVGSEQATRHYADCCLEAGVAMVNCIPVFISSEQEYADKFKAYGLPIVGDDIKAQAGATITHRVLADLWAQRGVILKGTFQENFGGNTDFLSMLAGGEERLGSKRKSKTGAVRSQIPYDIPPTHIHVGPSGYIPYKNDRKICLIEMEGEKFGGADIKLQLWLEVEDSPNSAGVAIDAIRCCKLGLERKIAGPLTSISSYTMKTPPEQYRDVEARRLTEAFIRNEIER